MAVVSTGEARDSLHQIARRFDAGENEPVYFGSHRRAQAVIVPVVIWERVLEHVEDDLDLDTAATRATTDARLSVTDVAALLQRLAATPRGSGGPRRRSAGSDPRLGRSGVDDALDGSSGQGIDHRDGPAGVRHDRGPGR